jgi:hypothetical protein
MRKNKEELLNRLNYHIANANTKLEDMQTNGKILLEPRCLDDLRIPPPKQARFLAVSFDHLRGLHLLYFAMNMLAFGIFIIEIIVHTLGAKRFESQDICCVFDEVTLHVNCANTPEQRQMLLQYVNMCERFLCENHCDNFVSFDFE